MRDSRNGGGRRVHWYTSISPSSSSSLLGADYASLDMWLSKKRLEIMTAEYIDMLLRLKLYNVATELIKDNRLQEISRLNAESTTAYPSCSQCNRALLGSGTVCEKCRKYSSCCSVCNISVKGLNAWCQGCGHGGHSRHIADWFDKHSVCPVVGCGHSCLKSAEL